MTMKKVSLGDIASKIRDLTIVTTFLLAILGTLGTLGADLIRPRIQAYLGIDQLVTYENLRPIIDTISELTGESGVLWMDRALSYVREPVTQGTDIELNLMMRRTQQGLKCVARRDVPIFTDYSNIPRPGAPYTPDQQADASLRLYRLTLTPPEGLLPGRVCVVIAKEYECGGQTTFDQTHPVCYTLI